MTARPTPYVIPPATLLIEGPAAVVDASVERHGNRELAEAFLEFLRSAEGQTILADYGFRPLDPRRRRSPAACPAAARLFTMADLGGWAKVNEEVYEPGGVWDRSSSTGGAARMTRRRCATACRLSGRRRTTGP